VDLSSTNIQSKSLERLHFDTRPDRWFGDCEILPRLSCGHATAIADHEQKDENMEKHCSVALTAAPPGIQLGNQEQALSAITNRMNPFQSLAVRPSGLIGITPEMHSSLPRTKLTTLFCRSVVRLGGKTICDRINSS
jgi:hypothetical protein